MSSAGPRWRVIFWAVGGGATAAMQIGKASAAIPVLAQDFGLDVGQMAFYLALFSFGAALVGLPVGLAAVRFGVLRAAVTGLTLIAVASLAGAFATSWEMVLALRALEAAGLPLVATTMPALVQAAAGAEHRNLAAAIWSAWLPIGVALALFLSVPVLAADQGWRWLFIACGVLPLIAIAGLVLSRPTPPAKAVPTGRGRVSAELIAMAMALLLFSAINLTFTGFVPSVAATDLGLSLQNGALYGGIAALLIILGNAISGIGLARGIGREALLLVAFGGMAVTAWAFLTPGLPVPVRILGGVLFNVATGMAPGVVWGQIPVLMRNSGMAASFIAGFYYQAAGIGQAGGPLLAGRAIEAVSGWSGGLLVILPCSALGMAFALLPRLDRRG